MNRSILRLAVPALGTLAADPLVSLVDTAFVARLGEIQLAALGVDAAIFGVAFVVFNFLAYGTTPLVARAVGAGDRREASRSVTTALVVAAMLGLVAVVALEVGSSWFVEILQAPDESVAPAVDYLRIRALAAPAVMVMMVGHGAYRGFQDTATPLRVTAGLSVANLVLDPLLIFGLGWGLAGAAVATVIAQWFGAAWFLWLLRGEWLGFRAVGRDRLFGFLRIGRQLTTRTVSLLAALTLATALAARAGVRTVAAHQVVNQLWFLSTLLLDSLAVAGQALVGRAVGREAPGEVGAIVRTLAGWGLAAGAALAVAFWAIRPWLPVWFGVDAGVAASIVDVMPLVAAIQPLGALLFVGDGVYIGAARFRFLTWSTLGAASVTVAYYLAVDPDDLVGIWVGVAVLLALRLASQLVDYARRGTVVLP